MKPGTYLIESGTEPSIQGAMGLYGVLVVTDPNYPGRPFDKDVVLLLGEIDPVQNAAVQQAVAAVGPWHVAAVRAATATARRLVAKLEVGDATGAGGKCDGEE